VRTGIQAVALGRGQKPGAAESGGNGGGMEKGSDKHQLQYFIHSLVYICIY
jgi:hypothetical protein